jgi:cysteine desulfurase
MDQSHHYLDYAATTPVDPLVFEAMLPYFQTAYGNPSSLHRWGQVAEASLEASRRTIADCLSCSPDEIIFTSGGSESNNLAIRGSALQALQSAGSACILTSPVEHPSVKNTVRQLAVTTGVEVDWLDVDRYGLVSPASLRQRLGGDVAFVSVMYAHNEVGSVNDIAELGNICREQGIRFHTDAVQAPNHLPLNVRELNVDMLSLGAHKCYGPKGIGLLYIRDGIKLVPHLTGGSQESNLRAGTPSIPLIVGFAAALKQAMSRQEHLTAQLQPLRDMLVHRVLSEIPDVQLTGHPHSRLPNHASFVFEGIESTMLIAALDLAGYGCSAGSACKAGNTQPSEILMELGWPEDAARGPLRVTLGRSTNRDVIEGFLVSLPPLVQRLREAGRSR